MFRVLFLLLLLLFAQASSARRRPADERYIRSFPQTVTPRVFLQEKVSNFRLSDDGRGHNLQYLPNNVLAIGVGVTLRGIGLNFSTGVPFHDQKEAQYGETRHLDIQVHRYSRMTMVDAYVQRYHGFHFADKSAVTYNPGPETYPYFPALQAVIIGASGLYVFNGRRYALGMLVNQQEWQVQSAGSFLLGGTVFSHQFSNGDSSILPRWNAYPDFFGGRKPKAIHYYGVTVNGGYGYNLVVGGDKHYFIAAAADIGVGPGYSSVADVDGENLSHVKAVATADARFGFGYNGEKWFAGLYGIFHADYYPLPYEQSSVTAAQGIGRLVVARRLSTHKRFLSKQPKTQVDVP